MPREPRCWNIADDTSLHGFDMRRIFLFWRPRPQQAAEAWALSPDQHRQVINLIADMGLSIVNEARGPVTLLTFGKRVMERLASDRQLFAVPLPEFADALKKVIRDMGDRNLRIMSPSDFPGVGYVYNLSDPETWPVNSGCQIKASAAG